MSLLRSVANGLGAELLTAFAAPAFAACDVSPQGVSFGNYDPLGPSDLDGVGSVNVLCDALTSFTVSLGSGSATIDDRRMTGGGAQLGYNLYQDSARLIIWGEGLEAISAVGNDVDLTVFGRIPAAQNVPASVYTDSVTVIVAF